MYGAEFDHFGVDHQHADVARGAGHQHRHDQGVQADALTGSGPAGDEQVRHLGEVDREGVTADVLTEENRDPHFLDVGGASLDQLAEADHDPFVVGDLDADGVLAGDRRDDADRRDAQRDREVVLEGGDLGDAESRFEFEFELGNDRTGVDFGDLHVQAEFGEGAFEDRGGDLRFFRQQLEGEVLGFFEQVEVRQFEVVVVGDGDTHWQPLHPAGRHGLDRRIHLELAGRGDGLVDLVGVFGCERFVRFGVVDGLGGVCGGTLGGGFFGRGKGTGFACFPGSRGRGAGRGDDSGKDAERHQGHEGDGSGCEAGDAEQERFGGEDHSCGDESAGDDECTDGRESFGQQDAGPLADVASAADDRTTTERGDEHLQEKASGEDDTEPADHADERVTDRIACKQADIEGDEGGEQSPGRESHPGLEEMGDAGADRTAEVGGDFVEREDRGGRSIRRVIAHEAERKEHTRGEECQRGEIQLEPLIVDHGAVRAR